MLLPAYHYAKLKERTQRSRGVLPPPIVLPLLPLSSYQHPPYRPTKTPGTKQRYAATTNRHILHSPQQLPPSATQPTLPLSTLLSPPSFRATPPSRYLLCRAPY
eukprot:3445673-Rhodomonas_salina.1